MKAQPVLLTGRRRISQLVVVLAVVGLVSAALFQSVWALVTPPAPSLGAAATFAVVGGSGVAFNGAVSTINGDVGSAPTPSITGLPASGTILPPFANQGLSAAAQAAVLSLETSLAGLGGAQAVLPELSGQSLIPGLYSVGAATLSGPSPLILNGPGVFIFQVASSLVTSTTSTVQLNNVDPCLVFWQVTSLATLNGVNFAGNVVAKDGVHVGTNSILTGRALATAAGDVTFAGNDAVGGCSGSSSLFLAKTSSTPSFSAVGNVISYSYLVTNTGTSTLAGPITVSDDSATVICPTLVPNTLLPGDSTICTATHTVNLTDMNAGFVTNKANAHAGNIVSNQATTTVPKATEVPAAAIKIVKKTNGSDNNVAPGPSLTIGSTATWTYVVTNTGGVLLTNVTVTDDHGVLVGCPSPGNGLISLGVGESVTCTGTGTVAAGQYTNIGTAAGTPAQGPLVTAFDVDHYFGKPLVCDDHTPPAVSQFSVITGPPKKVIIKAQDAGGAITSIVVSTAVNLGTVTYSLSPTGSPAVLLSGILPTAAAVYIVAPKLNQALGSVVGVTVKDKCNTTTFDPFDVTVNAGRRQAITVSDVGGDENLVSIVNDGLRSLRITVNQTTLEFPLRPKETRIVDIGRALVPGSNNTLTFEARGNPGASAAVLVYPGTLSDRNLGIARKHKHSVHEIGD